MALSNIFREPRREIVETLVGIVAVAAICVILSPIIYVFWRWPQLGFGVLLAVIVLWFFAFFTHQIGEELTAKLERRGIRLRPRRRY